MNDELLYSKAANNIYVVIQQLTTGANFSQFSYIMLHNIYLLTSFLYYQYNESVIADHLFDALCKYLLDNFDEIEKVVYYKEQTLSRDRLSAGTGYDLEMTPIWYGIVSHYRRISSVEFRQNAVKVTKESIREIRKQLPFF